MLYEVITVFLFFFFDMFINNTTAVAILIPVIITMSRAHNRPPSRLLMPLSYFSQLAGVITLIGTSTNISYNFV